MDLKETREGFDDLLHRAGNVLCVKNEVKFNYPVDIVVVPNYNRKREFSFHLENDYICNFAKLFQEINSHCSTTNLNKIGKEEKRQVHMKFVDDGQDDELSSFFYIYSVRKIHELRKTTNLRSLKKYNNSVLSYYPQSKRKVKKKKKGREYGMIKSTAKSQPNHVKPNPYGGFGVQMPLMTNQFYQHYPNYSQPPGNGPNYPFMPVFQHLPFQGSGHSMGESKNAENFSMLSSGSPFVMPQYFERFTIVSVTPKLGAAGTKIRIGIADKDGKFVPSVGDVTVFINNLRVGNNLVNPNNVVLTKIPSPTESFQLFVNCPGYKRSTVCTIWMEVKSRRSNSIFISNKLKKCFVAVTKKYSTGQNRVLPRNVKLKVVGTDCMESPISGGKKVDIFFDIFGDNLRRVSSRLQYIFPTFTTFSVFFGDTVGFIDRVGYNVERRHDSNFVMSVFTPKMKEAGKCSLRIGVTVENDELVTCSMNNFSFTQPNNGYSSGMAPPVKGNNNGWNTKLFTNLLMFAGAKEEDTKEVDFSQMQIREAIGKLVTYSDCCGFCVLTHAISRGIPILVKMCIERQYNLNRPDRFGNTSLHWAYFCGYQPIIVMLENSGAAQNVTNLYDKHPRDMAGERKGVYNGIDPEKGLMIEGNMNQNERRVKAGNFHPFQPLKMKNPKVSSTSGMEMNNGRPKQMEISNRSVLISQANMEEKERTNSILEPLSKLEITNETDEKDLVLPRVADLEKKIVEHTKDKEDGDNDDADDKKPENIHFFPNDSTLTTNLPFQNVYFSPYVQQMGGYQNQVPDYGLFNSHEGREMEMNVMPRVVSGQEKVIFKTSNNLIHFLPFHFSSRRNRKFNSFPFHEIGSDPKLKIVHKEGDGKEKYEAFGNAPYYKYTMKMRFFVDMSVAKIQLDDTEERAICSSLEVMQVVKSVKLAISEKNSTSETDLPYERLPGENQVIKEGNIFTYLYGFTIPKTVVSKRRGMDQKLFCFDVKVMDRSACRSCGFLVLNKLGDKKQKDYQTAVFNNGVVKAMENDIRQRQANVPFNILPGGISSGEMIITRTIPLHEPCFCCDGEVVGFEKMETDIKKYAFVCAFSGFVENRNFGFPSNKMNVTVYFRPNKTIVRICCTEKVALLSWIGDLKKDQGWDFSDVKEMSNVGKRELFENVVPNKKMKHE